MQSINTEADARAFLHQNSLCVSTHPKFIGLVSLDTLIETHSHCALIIEELLPRAAVALWPRPNVVYQQLKDLVTGHYVDLSLASRVTLLCNAISRGQCDMVNIILNLGPIDDTRPLLMLIYHYQPSLLAVAPRLFKSCLITTEVIGTTIREPILFQMILPYIPTIDPRWLLPYAKQPHELRMLRDYGFGDPSS
jgi:hypothetical protein